MIKVSYFSTLSGMPVKQLYNVVMTALFAWNRSATVYECSTKASPALPSRMVMKFIIY